MNIRNVLRTYSLLRQLTDDESALLETLRNATEAERELLVETLAPQKSTTKRAGRKSASKGASKSSRAQSLSGVIQRTPKMRTNNNDDEDGPRCTYPMGDDAPCNATEHSPLHKEDGGYLTWHEFQPAASPVAREAGVGG